jgi:hypothetical protein
VAKGRDFAASVLPPPSLSLSQLPSLSLENLKKALRFLISLDLAPLFIIIYFICNNLWNLIFISLSPLFNFIFLYFKFVYFTQI